MRTRNYTWNALLFVLLILLTGLPAIAQDVPPQIDQALAALSQGERANITLDDLSEYDWSQQDFADTSLGCPRPGQNYAQVVTPGYQFSLTYDGTIYDYRVSEDGETVILCDSRPIVPGPTPITETPEVTCDGQYTVNEGDILIDIAQQCNTTVAALMAANPDIPDPSLIFSGQTLVIPENTGQRYVSIRPESGPPGTVVNVYASGFPPGSQVQLGIGPPASEYEVVANREIGADGQLATTLQIGTNVSPPDERVVVVVLNFEETVSEVFTITEPQASTPTPTDPNDGDGLTTETQFYLVALEDGGRSGNLIGCGDSLVPITIAFQPTEAPLTAALEELFAIETRTYGQSGLYNALYRSDLSVESTDVTDSVATISLSGTLRTGGVCDEPRIMSQLEEIALQYPTIDSVSISINGTPLESSF